MGPLFFVWDMLHIRSKNRGSNWPWVFWYESSPGFLCHCISGLLFGCNRHDSYVSVALNNSSYTHSVHPTKMHTFCVLLCLLWFRFRSSLSYLSQVSHCDQGNHTIEEECAHFCSEWCIVGFGTDAFWDLWIWSVFTVLLMQPWGTTVNRSCKSNRNSKHVHIPWYLVCIAGSLASNLSDAINNHEESNSSFTTNRSQVYMSNALIAMLLSVIWTSYIIYKRKTKQ